MWIYSMTTPSATGPHAGQPVLRAGEPLESARAALVLLHGRGASAADILAFGQEVAGADVALLAPEAAGNTWYPYSFLAPLERNEPWLSSALSFVRATVATVEAAGIPAARTMLLGFSQGGCLALEFAARNARRYGGIVGLSSGLIGPDGTPRDYPGSLDGTPVFLGCSDVDLHIPAARVRETADSLTRLGANVTMRLYPGMGHIVNEDELATVRAMVAHLAA